MTSAEPEDVAITVIATINRAFPGRGYDTEAVMLFSELLHDVAGDPDGVMRAVMSCLKNAKHPPTVGEVREEYGKQHGLIDGESIWPVIRKNAQINPYMESDPRQREPLPNAAAEAALESIGGYTAVSRSTHPELMRKDFLNAYGHARSEIVRSNELGALGSGRNIHATAGAIEGGEGAARAGGSRELGAGGAGPVARAIADVRSVGAEHVVRGARSITFNIIDSGDGPDDDPASDESSGRPAPPAEGEEGD